MSVCGLGDPGFYFFALFTDFYPFFFFENIFYLAPPDKNVLDEPSFRKLSLAKLWESPLEDGPVLQTQFPMSSGSGCHELRRATAIHSALVEMSLASLYKCTYGPRPVACGGNSLVRPY